MTISFLVLALITIAGTAAAMALRDLMHCIIALILGFVGLAGLYLQLGAQFVGFTQVLVYVGAVAILVVFAILMTKSAEPMVKGMVASSLVKGIAVAGFVFAVLAWAISSAALPGILPLQPEVSVNQVGVAMMHGFVLPLEIVALLLTAALIGAGILAMDQAWEKQ